MLNNTLRTSLVRLAHNHPEFRKEILPILTKNHTKQASSDVVYRDLAFHVDYTEEDLGDGKSLVEGKISIRTDTGGKVSKRSIRFELTLVDNETFNGHVSDISISPPPFDEGWEDFLRQIVFEAIGYYPIISRTSKRATREGKWGYTKQGTKHV